MRLKVVKSLNEAFSIGNGVLAFVSGYDLINWLDGIDKYSGHRYNEIRILWDQQQKMYFAGNAYDMIHQDIIKTAFESGEYKFPFQYKDWFDRTRKIETNSDWSEYYTYCQGLISFAFDKHEYMSGLFVSDTYYTIVYFDGFGEFYLREDDLEDHFINSDVYKEAVKRYGKPHIRKI